jgi:ABC-type phosphate transport system substrate-binding protein
LWFGASNTASADSDAAAFIVIVNHANALNSDPQRDLADRFLKKLTRWPDGKPTLPVDQRPDSEVRKAFSKSILHRSATAVRNYWQQRIFSGRGVPPPEFDSDAAVVAYVRKHPGAVGYVSPRAKLDGVKPLQVH